VKTILLAVFFLSLAGTVAQAAPARYNCANSSGKMKAVTLIDPKSRVTIRIPDQKQSLEFFTITRSRKDKGQDVIPRQSFDLAVLSPPSQHRPGFHLKSKEARLDILMSKGGTDKSRARLLFNRTWYSCKIEKV
jgi:hypothetical protein